MCISGSKTSHQSNLGQTRHYQCEHPPGVPAWQDKQQGGAGAGGHGEHGTHGYCAGWLPGHLPQPVIQELDGKAVGV